LTSLYFSGMRLCNRNFNMLGSGGMVSVTVMRTPVWKGLVAVPKGALDRGSLQRSVAGRPPSVAPALSLVFASRKHAVQTLRVSLAVVRPWGLGEKSHHQAPQGR
jgi:hypothetical protein